MGAQAPPAAGDRVLPVVPGMVRGRLELRVSRHSVTAGAAIAGEVRRCSEEAVINLTPSQYAGQYKEGRGAHSRGYVR